MAPLRILLAACAAALALPSAASAARTVYFADRGADAIAQFAVGSGGALAALAPAAVPAHDPQRLAMTPAGTDLYATAEHGVLQYDVGPAGRLSPKRQPLAKIRGRPHSIAIHPSGSSAYVTDLEHGKVRQFDVGSGGALLPKDPVYVKAGAGARGIAVSPNGRTVYVLVTGGIVSYAVAANGSLTRRGERLDVPSWALEDVALTPDGARLYATSGDGRLFAFTVAADGSPAPDALPSVPLDGRAVGVAIAPDGSSVYVAARRVLALTTGLGLVGAADAGSKRLRYLSVSPDGKSLFVAGGDGHLFDLGAGGAPVAKTPPRVDLHAALGVVVSPNQAPVASFAAAPGDAGSATRFDASTATDPDGTIVRYDWDFGDGTRLADGGPSPQHTYTRPGTYTVTLVVTDNEGASTTTIFTGGTVLGNGAPGAQASRQIEVGAAAAPPPGPAQEPQPDLGETLVADPVAGTVRVRLKGRRRFVALRNVRELPIGSTLDTRDGRVEVATERRRRGRYQRGVFFGGYFVVRQRAATNYVTDLVLRGSLSDCPRGSASAARRTRRLWGNGRGRFRTRGRYSSGAVRGTRWLTADRCDGTLTIVRRGTVAVRDFSLRRTVVLDAGERYLARPR